jgi:hypothetical protein
MRWTQAHPRSPSVSSRPRTWPWAAGSILAVVVVLAGTLIGQRIATSIRHAAATVPAPAQPALPITGATPAGVHVQYLALDASAGHLLALTSATQPECPPVGACPPAPPLTSFAVFDARSGALLATTPLTGDAAPAAASVLLLADPTRQIAYAVAPSSVTIFSTVTGAHTGGYLLPGIPWPRELGGVLDTAHGALILTGRGWLVTLDAASGRLLASRNLGALSSEGPLLDGAHGRVYVLTRTGPQAAPTLAAYDARTLDPLGQASLAPGTHLGALDPAGTTLYAPGPDGAPCRYALGISDGTLTAAPAPAPALCNALALGWNDALGHLYVAQPEGFSVRDAASLRAVAELPLRVAWPLAQRLLVDAARGTLYLPDADGTVLIAHDGGPPAPLSSGTAVLLARAALDRFLPDTNQDPPFLSAGMFPAAVGTQSRAFWVHYADLGWRGPYAGQTQVAVAPLPGQFGGYRVTFSLSWNQLFVRQHVWICDVAPDGAVRLFQSTGDVIP